MHLDIYKIEKSKWVMNTQKNDIHKRELGVKDQKCI